MRKLSSQTGEQGIKSPQLCQLSYGPKGTNELGFSQEIAPPLNGGTGKGSKSGSKSKSAALAHLDPATAPAQGPKYRSPYACGMCNAGWSDDYCEGIALDGLPCINAMPPDHREGRKSPRWSPPSYLRERRRAAALPSREVLEGGDLCLLAPGHTCPEPDECQGRGVCQWASGTGAAVGDAKVPGPIGAARGDAPRAGDAAGVDLVTADVAVGPAAAFGDPGEIAADVAGGRPGASDVVTRLELARRGLDGVAGFDRVAARIGLPGIDGDALRDFVAFGVGGLLGLGVMIEARRRDAAAADHPEPNPRKCDDAKAHPRMLPDPESTCAICHEVVDARRALVIHRRGGQVVGFAHVRCEERRL